MLEIAGVKLERINPRAVVSMEGEVVPTHEGFNDGIAALVGLLEPALPQFGCPQVGLTAAAGTLPDQPWFNIFTGIVQARIMGAATDQEAAEQTIAAVVTSFLQGAISACMMDPQWMGKRSPTRGLEGTMMLAQEHWSGYSDFAIAMMSHTNPRAFAMQMIAYGRLVRSCWSAHFKGAFRYHCEMLCMMPYIAGAAMFESINFASAALRKAKTGGEVN